MKKKGKRKHHQSCVICARERDGIFCVRGGLAKATEKALYTQPLQHNTNGRTNRKRQVQKTKELIQGRRNKKHRNIRGS